MLLRLNSAVHLSLNAALNIGSTFSWTKKQFAWRRYLSALRSVYIVNSPHIRLLNDIRSENGRIRSFFDCMHTAAFQAGFNRFFFHLPYFNVTMPILIYSTRLWCYAAVFLSNRMLTPPLEVVSGAGDTWHFSVVNRNAATNGKSPAHQRASCHCALFRGWKERSCFVAQSTSMKPCVYLKSRPQCWVVHGAEKSSFIFECMQRPSSKNSNLSSPRFT